MDTSRTIEIGVSPWRMVLALLAGLVMTALASLIAFHVVPDDRLNATQQVAGILGVPFFGACAAVAAWRLAMLRRPVVTLSPDGFRDVRVAADLIPWTAIEHVTTWRHRRQRAMMLAFRPEIETGLTLTRIARWTRGANRRLGADGLAIMATDLTMGYDELLAATTARVRDGRP